MDRRKGGGWLALTFALTACGGESPDEAGGRELWERIQAEDYRGWSRAPGWETRQPTVSAHGHEADIFVNAALDDAIDGAPRSEWPLESLLVKDSYRDGALVLIAAMEKREGGWYFAEWDGSGNLEFAGSPDVCRGCHDAAEDSVFSLGLP